MFNAHCMICTDKNKFRMAVDDANRITHRLRELIYKHKDIEIEVDRKEYMKLQSSIPGFYSMCGHCPKINELELNNAERSLVEMVVKIKALLQNEGLDDKDKNILKHNAFNFLRGFYPVLARYIEMP